MLLVGERIVRSDSSHSSSILALLSAAGLPVDDIATASELTFWIANCEGRLLGVVGLERRSHSGLLRSLAVVRERRQRGLGRALVRHVEQAALEQGIAELFLLTETARTFFEKLGYRMVSRDEVSESLLSTAEFQTLCSVTAVCMSKVLRG